jgi:hypothetical protein
MNDSERRRSPRRGVHDDHGIVSTKIRPGHPARIIDVSAGGALIETPQRLLPGRTLELQIEGRDRREIVRGSIVRCSVARVCATSVCYRAAIHFERHLPWFAEPPIADGYELPSADTSGGRVTQSVL